MGDRKQIIRGGALFGTLILACLVYNLTFNTKHRVIADEQVDFVLTAKDLQAYFSADEQEAVGLYLDRVLQLSGQVTEVEEASVVLDDRVQINFLEAEANAFQRGQELTVKGRCVGYDELLLQVKIDQASTPEITRNN